MDELNEIDSINRIEVDRIGLRSGIKVYVNIYQNVDYEYPSSGTPSWSGYSSSDNSLSEAEKTSRFP